MSNYVTIENIYTIIQSQIKKLSVFRTFISAKNVVMP